jgi:hypothetical protein
MSIINIRENIFDNLDITFLDLFVDYLGVSVLTSVTIDCVVVLSCGLTPSQCTSLDSTKLAKQYLSDLSKPINSQCTIVVNTLQYLTIR